MSNFRDECASSRESNNYTLIAELILVQWLSVSVIGAQLLHGQVSIPIFPRRPQDTPCSLLLCLRWVFQHVRQILSCAGLKSNLCTQSVGSAP